MALEICVLASGSSGNCTAVLSEKTRILIDAGLSARETAARLGQLDIELSHIDAILISHEHSDHRGSLRALYRKAGAELFANAPTLEALERDPKLRELQWNVFTTGQQFAIGDLTIEPFSVPHDSYDPVGFIVTDGDSRIGIVTDMGIATGLIRERLKNCDVLVLESNHDEEMLKESPRPWSLKQRIMGRQGHFSNRQAGELLCEVTGTQLHTVLLAHLSSDCNRPDLALQTVRDILAARNLARVKIDLTYPDRPSAVISSVRRG